MRILVDMDGVLADLCAKWFAAWNEATGDALHHDRVTTYAVHEHVDSRAAAALAADLADLTPREFDDPCLLVYRVIRRPGFFDDLAPYPGAVEGFRRLRARGHEVLVCTAAAGPDSARAKLAWCERVMALSDRDVVITNHKHLVDADAIVEDCGRNVRLFMGDEMRLRCAAEMLNVRRRRRSALVCGYPHNREFSVDNCDVYAEDYHSNSAAAWEDFVEWAARQRG